MLSLGKLLNPREFDKYIEETNSFETVVHKYGTPFNVPDYPCWMEYRDEKRATGSISFTRNTIKNSVLNEMSKKVAAIIDNITIKEFTPDPNRVHFIKTRGTILPHRDEASRMCCINIGIKNSNSAVTKIANKDIHVDFYNNSTDYILEDGFGFLVNTHNYHAVSGHPDITRYLITYGFGREFDQVKNIFQNF